MDLPQVKIRSVVLLKRNTWHYRFKHKPTCRFSKNPNIWNLPVVRISRISRHRLFGKIFWFSKMCGCFPAAHVHKVKNGKIIKIIRRKTSCPVQLEHCGLFDKAAY